MTFDRRLLPASEIPGWPVADYHLAMAGALHALARAALPEGFGFHVDCVQREGAMIERTAPEGTTWCDVTDADAPVLVRWVGYPDFPMYRGTYGQEAGIYEVVETGRLFAAGPGHARLCERAEHREQLATMQIDRRPLRSFAQIDKDTRAGMLATMGHISHELTGGLTG